MNSVKCLCVIGMLVAGCGDNLVATPDAGPEALSRCGRAPTRPVTSWHVSNLCVQRDIVWTELEEYWRGERWAQAIDRWAACVEGR